MQTKFEPNMDPVQVDNLPAHVPPELVRNLDWAFGFIPVDFDEPHRETARFFEEGVPRAMWVPDAGRAHAGKGAWVFTHYDDIVQIYQDAETFSTKGAAGYQRLAGETFDNIPLGKDPPEHMQYRKLLNPFFSPKAVSILEVEMRAKSHKLIEECIVGKNACDIAYDFARVFPVQVFLDLMGYPQDQLDQFLDWESKILHGGDPEVQVPAIKSILAYLRGFIADVRENGSSGITQDIVNGQVDGRPITEDEIMGVMFFLWLGGLDTVAATLSLLFRRLALDHDLQDHLRNNPETIPDAVEEFLRTQPLVNSQRIVKKDVEIGGVKMKRDDLVMCMVTAGNFDPGEFESPRTLNLERQPNRHFTFAGGPHRCMGSHIARRELRVALEELLPRIPMFSLASDDDRMVHPGLRSVRNLNIVW